MTVSPQLMHLIDTAAPLFAGEAEVVRTYWDSPVRTVETDLLWLDRQCFKEFKGSGVGELQNMGVIYGPLKEVTESLPKMDKGVSRHHIEDVLEGLYEEFTHLVAFADAYDAIRPDGTPPIDIHACQGWEEDNVLTQKRYDILAEHGELGLRASKFSEGGYCALFREGMALAGREGSNRGDGNDAIAAACRKVFDDEFVHMLQGIVGLDADPMPDEDWGTLERLVVELLRLRVHMRNGQFSYPVSQERIDAIFAGDIEPVEFDLDGAQQHIAAE